MADRALLPPLPDAFSDRLTTARSYATWLLAHGVQRRLLTRAAARGDLIARLSVDPQVVADPFATYEQLRARGPLSDNGLVHGTVDHAVCNEVLRSDAFNTGGGHAELPVPLRRLLHRLLDPAALGPIDPPSMLVVDPPVHTHYRKQVARAFTARKVGRLADRVEVVAERLLDELAGTDEFDLVERYASLLPVAVIADLLGVSEADHGLLLELGNRAAVTLDPALTWRQYRTADTALRDMHRWFADHVASLRREPGDDLISQLATDTGPDALDEVALHQVGLLVLGAGFETTVNLIGNAVVLLDAHPDQLAWLLADDERWPGAVEEVLRHQSPVQVTLRAANTDVEVAGHTLRSGSGVLLFLGGANRDPAVFTDPAAFDVARPNAGEHLAFSAGVHFCLGASLARLETAVALRVLYRRHPQLRLAGAPARRRTRVLRGFEQLPVTTRAHSSVG
ncbi:cytochrome P450 [Nocardioides sp. zg-536]|uniref:Cytochrome P450 n=1 Tax=Nocardioides faecalis TaxID=2803858 RepID=A0A938Y628_9ACTN|nr:cytochrome P450 [Nocardioides faecalis]MBM9459884.1 cytochrome P450 [Nocardioides faecalis]QVI58882.1 cytochrome P450 [Nocardioides faecalis]